MISLTTMNISTLNKSNHQNSTLHTKQIHRIILITTTTKILTHPQIPIAHPETYLPQSSTNPPSHKPLTHPNYTNHLLLQGALLRQNQTYFAIYKKNKSLEREVLVRSGEFSTKEQVNLLLSNKCQKHCTSI